MAEQVKISTKLKKDDQVIVIAGKDKGKSGKILRIDTKKARVVVEGVNMVKKAVKKKNAQDRGGIVEIEASLHISNVQIADKGGKPARITYKIEGDAKTRVSAKTGDKV
jgi:large subunit ribosomal protein L24